MNSNSDRTTIAGPIGDEDPSVRVPAHIYSDQRPKLADYERDIMSNVTDRIRTNIYGRGDHGIWQRDEDLLFLLEIAQKYLVTK